MQKLQPQNIVPEQPISPRKTTQVITYDATHLCAESQSFSSATVYCSVTGESLPSIVLVGGWMCGEHVIGAWAPFFASHGIVVMTIGIPYPGSGMATDRCQALLDASRALQSEHTREGSQLFGRLDVSLTDPALKCAIALAPHSGAPFDDPFPTKLTDSVPMLFIVGNADTEAPAHDQSQPHYNITNAPSLLFEINGGDHYTVTGPSGGDRKDFQGDIDGLCMLGNVICSFLCCGFAPCPYGFLTGPSGLAADDAVRGEISEIALAWLQLFLQGDESARLRLLEQPSIASRFEMKNI